MRSPLSSLACALGGLLILTTSGCDGEEPRTDAGLEDAAPSERACGRSDFPELVFEPSVAGVAPGTSREVWLEWTRHCARETEIRLTTSDEGVIEAPSAVTLDENRSRALVRIVGLATGSVSLVAEARRGDDHVEARLEVDVREAARPACGGEVSGRLEPGARIEVTSGTLAGAAIALPEGAARMDDYRVESFDVSVSCAEDIVPEGYVALGPAVTFGPAHARLPRDIPLTLPISLAHLPDRAHRGHVELVWRGPDEAPRLVIMGSPTFSGRAGEGWLSVEMPRLGTYQAVARADAPRARARTFEFRGVTGFSMGGSGTGRLGTTHPELFDVIAPLGGPTDWIYLLEYMRTYHLGGFCTEDERQADPVACAEGRLDRVPPSTQLHEHIQHFEHWWYEDGYEGQGGTFDRGSYLTIFRDIAFMFGNPNTDRSVDPFEPGVTPPGVPEEARQGSNFERCQIDRQVVIPPFDGEGDRTSGTEGHGYFDDEYNPEGAYPVITFCDGVDTPGDVGLWNPEATPRIPTELVMAVDIDGDGLRGPGEPVIRSVREPYDDFGLDGVPSELEAGYDPITRPDPAGDDFDFQYNPLGTERNWLRDTIDGDPCRPGAPGEAEAFLDVGLDGVPGTRQLVATADLPGGGFDFGEGNGCFDRARGARALIEATPRRRIMEMDEATLDDLNVFADGGIRDLFNWSVMADMTMAGLLARGRPTRLYNGHGALHLDGRPDDAFEGRRVPWREVGNHALVRYGDVDATESRRRDGDGGHVGTLAQLFDRFIAALSAMDQAWPDGDRRRVVDDRVCTRISERCPNINSFVLDFTDDLGRTGPVSVVLPPGYFDPENADVRYPVVYFLHGYGMVPEDLLAVGLVMWDLMNSSQLPEARRLQKMIFVFPDGNCRGDEGCLRGTFYTDAPPSSPNGPQMGRFLLDLIDHIDANYRTRSAETFDVVE